MTEDDHKTNTKESLGQSSILDLLDNVSFRQRFKKMLNGFRAPRDSGAYRYARQEFERLWAPFLAIVIPLLIALLLIYVDFGPRDTTLEFMTEIIEPETMEDLEQIEEITEQPTDVETMDVSVPLNFEMAATPDISTPDAPETPAPSSFNDVAIVRSPVILRGMFSSRTAEGRSRGLSQHAGRHAGATEQAVNKALEWLKRNQLEDGSWQGSGSARSKTAMTGLGLLTFLAHGETPASQQYGATVRKAIQFLLDNQRPDGTFKNTEGGNRGGVYAHGIASYALSEAFALTLIPMVRDAMEKAISHIVRGQRPDGGFDYKFERNTGERDRCSSVAGWMAQALKAASLAGARVEGLSAAIDKAAEGFKAQYVRDRNQFMYSSKSGAVRKSMTPICTLCLQLLGHAGSSEARSGLAALREWAPDWDNPDMSGGILEPIYVWYYTTQAFFHQGGSAWQRWNNLYAPMIVEHQNEDGSWGWQHGRSEAYGPVYHTTLNALSLMVYYRYLPTYQSIAIEEIETSILDESDIEVFIDI